MFGFTDCQDTKHSFCPLALVKAALIHRAVKQSDLGISPLHQPHKNVNIPPRRSIPHSLLRFNGRPCWLLRPPQFTEEIEALLQFTSQGFSPWH